MTTPPGSLFVFYYGGKIFGLSFETVEEVLPMPLLSFAPGMPGVLAGFLNLGGEAIPVLNPKILFGLKAETPERDAHLLVIAGQRRSALRVDRAEGLLELSSPAVRADEKETFNGLVGWIAQSESGPLYVLRPGRLLLEEEARRLEEFRTIEQDRLAAVGRGG